MPAKRRIRSKVVCAAALFGMVALLAAPGRAQNALRVVYEIEKSSSPQTHVVGKVWNDGPADVVDVSVTAEALDRNGRVVASGITYVDARIARGDSRPFTAVIPPVPNAVRYRVTATGTRAGFGMQSP